MLVVLAALLWWQARYDLTVIHNPMYGWPMTFNNVWGGSRPEWRPGILLVDSVVWLALAGATGHVFELWRQKPNKHQITIRGLLVLESVTACVLALGCVEQYLRSHADSASLVPKYARWDIGESTIYFDVGLFTDPPRSWPLIPIRITIAFALGCAIFTTGHLLCAACRLAWDRVRKGHNVRPPSPIDTQSTRTVANHDCTSFDAPRAPFMASIVIFLLTIAVILLAIYTLFPPMVQ